MGCISERPLQQTPLNINGVFILNREPTQGRHSQSVEIKVVHDDGLWDTNDDPRVKVVEEDYKLTLTLPADSPEIQSNSLQPVISNILMRANKANKTTLLIQELSFTTDNPLLAKSITSAVFQQLAIAIADFASRVDLRSLKCVYFRWQQELVSQLYGKVQEPISSMKALM